MSIVLCNNDFVYRASLLILPRNACNRESGVLVDEISTGDTRALGWIAHQRSKLSNRPVYRTLSVRESESELQLDIKSIERQGHSCQASHVQDENPHGAQRAHIQGVESEIDQSGKEIGDQEDREPTLVESL